MDPIVRMHFFMSMAEYNPLRAIKYLQQKHLDSDGCENKDTSSSIRSIIYWIDVPQLMWHQALKDRNIEMGIRWEKIYRLKIYDYGHFPLVRLKKFGDLIWSGYVVLEHPLLLT